MTFEQIADKISGYQKEGKKLFTTSSFQTHSIVLLHILSRIDNTIPVYCLNTGYLFPKTLAFRDHISKSFQLNIINLSACVPKSMQRDSQGRLLFTSDPDRCCYLNKTQPLENVLATHDVWINGVRADQSATRKAMKMEQEAPHNSLRFHPMLDWTPKMIYVYRKKYDLA